MPIKIGIPKEEQTLRRPIITVFAVGGAGGNAINNMINSKLEGARFISANTDAQALEHSLAETKIQLGNQITNGLGAGANPDIGSAAAEEAITEIMDAIEGSNIVFITAGMGGGTGTGAAPVVARAAKEKGILTIGVVTKPFNFEGIRRMEIAEEGIAELAQYVDTLIVIPNQNLFKIADEKTTFSDAFKLADKVLYSGVQGITDLMMMPGLINLDFADIKTVMSEMGKAMMGAGEAEGENRAIKAAEAAISNPLLAHASMKGAQGVLINITGGNDPTIAWIDGLVLRVMFCGALKVVQTPVEVVTYAFDMQNVTIIDYDAAIWSGFELISQKTVGGVINQMKHFYGLNFDALLGNHDFAGDL